MKYFIDTEFLEGTQKEKFPISLFRKNTPNTIDLISIGIVSEDGREYYAISKDFNLKEAWNRYDLKETSPAKKYIGIYEEKVYWIRENVLKAIYQELVIKSENEWYAYASVAEYDLFLIDVGAGKFDRHFTFKNFKRLINKYGKSNKQIAEEVKHFCDSEYHIAKSNARQKTFAQTPEFYAYYANYDWVVFCWLFGKMIDLPKGFPMYCIDLKQLLDEKQIITNNKTWDKIVSAESVTLTRLYNLKNNINYPKQENEHSAIDDARWNYKLYYFLQKI